MTKKTNDKNIYLIIFLLLPVCMGDAPSKPDPAPVRLALEKIGKQRYDNSKAKFYHTQ